MKFLSRVIKGITWFLALLIICTLIPPTRIGPSMLVMQLNNYVQNKNALTIKEGIKIKMPAGYVSDSQKWYPFVMTYDASHAFSRKIDRDVDLTILYNFAGYNPLKGRSRLYEHDSPYLGSFYGAYLLKNNDTAFAYLFNDEGDIQVDALTSVARYDYLQLVLGGFGAPYASLNFDVISNEFQSIDLKGERWTQVTSIVQTNSPRHPLKSFKMSYLQYGLPEGKEGDQFSKMTLYSRVLVRKIEQAKTTVALYAMSTDEAFLDQMTKSLLLETEIEYLK